MEGLVPWKKEPPFVSESLTPGRFSVIVRHAVRSTRKHHPLYGVSSLTEIVPSSQDKLEHSTTWLKAKRACGGPESSGRWKAKVHMSSLRSSWLPSAPPCTFWGRIPEPLAHTVRLTHSLTSLVPIWGCWSEGCPSTSPEASAKPLPSEGLRPGGAGPSQDGVRQKPRPPSQHLDDISCCRLQPAIASITKFINGLN